MGLSIRGILSKAAGLIDNPVGGILDAILQKKGVDKLTPLEKTEALSQVREGFLSLTDEALENDSSWRGFMLQYEGKAEDQHVSIKVLRGSIRPVITIAVMVELFLLLNGWVSINSQNVPPEFWNIVQIVLGFWFGGRMLEGVVQSLKTGKKT